MPASEFLKKMRSNDYEGRSAKGSESEGMDSGEPHETPRMISLTDDELKYFENANPGEDLACEVHGTLERDGHFHVMSVRPLSGSYDKGMSEEVMNRVQPGSKGSESY